MPDTLFQRLTVQMYSKNGRHYCTIMIQSLILHSVECQPWASNVSGHPSNQQNSPQEAQLHHHNNTWSCYARIALQPTKNEVLPTLMAILNTCLQLTLHSTSLSRSPFSTPMYDIQVFCTPTCDHIFLHSVVCTCQLHTSSKCVKGQICIGPYAYRTICVEDWMHTNVHQNMCTKLNLKESKFIWDQMYTGKIYQCVCISLHTASCTNHLHIIAS